MKAIKLFKVIISMVLLVLIIVSCKEASSLDNDSWDIVKFGLYPQSDVSGSVKEPIEWIVLDKQGNRKLLLSKYILDCKRYNNEFKAVSWETCSLRSWLNNNFYYMAFNEHEQKIIQNSNIINNNTFYQGLITDGGSNTNDKVFCLSIEEITKYFYESDIKIENKKVTTTGTYYAKNIDNFGHNLDVCRYSEWYIGNSYFWLRSPGSNQYGASYVNWDGYLHSSGISVDSDYCGVRPAIWIID